MRRLAAYRAVDGKLYCRHGLILYGTKCVTCEREARAAMTKDAR